MECPRDGPLVFPSICCTPHHHTCNITGKSVWAQRSNNVPGLINPPNQNKINRDHSGLVISLELDGVQSRPLARNSDVARLSFAHLSPFELDRSIS
jgi:hypothetical protein